MSMDKKKKSFLKATILLQLFIFWTVIGTGFWIGLGPKIAQANVVGPSHSNFAPAPSYDDYITVQSARTTPIGTYDLGLFYDLGINSYPYFDTENVKQGFGTINDTVHLLHPTLTYGLRSNWDLGVTTPLFLFDTVREKDSFHGEFQSFGLTQLRLFSKYNFINQSLLSLALSGSLAQSLSGGDPLDGKSTQVILELIVESQIGPWSLAGNMGYRSPGNNANDKFLNRLDAITNQLLLSAAIGYSLQPNASLVGETYFSLPFAEQPNLAERHTGRWEWLMAYDREWATNKTFQIGLGTEVRHSLSSADFRFFAGMKLRLGNEAPAAIPIQTDELDLSDLSGFDYENPDETIRLEDVFFRYNSDRVARGQGKALASIARRLKAKDLQTIIIEGHTCNIGATAFNQQLSVRRAQRIKSILVRDHGLSPNLIQTRGLGQMNPIASNESETGRKRNRRVEFKIYENS